MFNWRAFCDGHNIPYVTSGPNTRASEISIQCPWCGDDDPSQHMGLAVNAWGCLRNHSHRGYRPHRLIMRLLGCSYQVADGYVQGGRELSEFDRLAAAFKAKMQGEEQFEGELDFPEQSKPLKVSGRGRIYANYLLRRGFHEGDVLELRKSYGLRYCDRGYWRGRILFPVYMGGRLVTWTGRTIYKSEELRYLSLSDRLPKEGSSQPRALMNIKDTVWNYDVVMSERWRVVAVVEGPMDAMKVDFYGREFGVRATCLYGTGVTEQQKYLLGDLQAHCKRFLIIPDDGAYFNEMDLASELRHLRPAVLRCPDGVEDPGALTRKQVVRLFSPFL